MSIGRHKPAGATGPVGCCLSAVLDGRLASNTAHHEVVTVWFCRRGRGVDWGKCDYAFALVI